MPIDATIPIPQDAPWAIEWWGKRHVDKLIQAKAANINLLFLGDSITQGWETDGVEYWSYFCQKYNAFNLGFGGDRTEHVLWRIQHGALDNIAPQLTVLLIGTNNTGHRMDNANHTVNGIRAILSELRTRLPKSKILLLAILPRHYRLDNEMRLRNEQVNHLISEFDDNRHIFYRNINHIFVDEHGMLKKALMPDLLHPNQAGYQILSQVIDPIISQLINQE